MSILFNKLPSCGHRTHGLGQADSPTSDFSCPSSAKNLSEAQIIDYTDNSITYNELKVNIFKIINLIMQLYPWP